MLHHEPDETCTDCATGGCNAALCIDCGASATTAAETMEIATTP